MEDKYPNDVGAGWKKTNDKGEYISVSLDVDKLMKLAGGVTGEKLNLSMYPVRSDHPRAPDYQLRFYPKGAGAGRSAAPRPLNDTDRAPQPQRSLNDGDIPF